MKTCTDHEVELSALLDGESDPATAVKLLDHVTACTSCSAFFRRLRSFQIRVNEIPTASPERAVAPPVRQRWYAHGVMPRWAWGMAGAFVVMAGLWMAFVFDPAASSGFPAQAQVIRLGEDKGRMDDERFVELASEILRAEKRYRDQMYIVLNEINRGAVSPLFDGVGEDAPSEFSGELASLTGESPILD